jgi:hypothetical protein
MSHLLKILSHPSWQGIGAIVGIAGLVLAAYSAYLAVGQPSPQLPSPQPHPTQTISQNPNAELINEGLPSIDENYGGVHKYFNDWKPLAVISIILILGGLGALFHGRRATGTKL